MGAVRMRVQTADKNTTIIHKHPHDSSPSINILCNKNLCVCDKQFTIKTFLNSDHCFQVESGEKYAQIRHCLQAKSVQNSLNTNMLVDFDVRGQQEKDVFTGGSIIIDYGLIFWPEVML